MKRFLCMIPLVILPFFLSVCSQPGEKGLNIEVDKGASVIKDAFELKEDDNLRILEFSLESKDSALVKFSINGNRLSSKIKKTEASWKLVEIQDKQMEWTPAENYLMIKGTLKSEPGSPIAKRSVTLYETHYKGKELQATIKVGKEGILLNPSSMTDSGGSFTILADRRFWEKSGSFTLGVSLWNGEAYLRDKNGVHLVIQVDKKTKTVALGEIKVSI